MWSVVRTKFHGCAPVGEERFDGADVSTCRRILVKEGDDVGLASDLMRDAEREPGVMVSSERLWKRSVRQMTLRLTDLGDDLSGHPRP